ncbi:MAG: hypothetical protein M1825_001222 [Sarcosagium campestre]|nr:MAG: hypothetical protein M1825_001222 [Sarcosagium campestre]
MGELHHLPARRYQRACPCTVPKRIHGKTLTYRELSQYQATAPRERLVKSETSKQSSQFSQGNGDDGACGSQTRPFSLTESHPSLLRPARPHGTTNLMASVPAKRRKITPTSASPSVPLNAPTTPENLGAANIDVGRSTPKRASFSSPTKASLARFNPRLLSPSKSTSRRASRTPSPSKDATSFANVTQRQRNTGRANNYRAAPREDGLSSVEQALLDDARAQAQAQPFDRRRSLVDTGLGAAPRRRSGPANIAVMSSELLQSIARDAESIAESQQEQASSEAPQMDTADYGWDGDVGVGGPEAVDEEVGGREAETPDDEPALPPSLAQRALSSASSNPLTTTTTLFSSPGKRPPRRARNPSSQSIRPSPLRPRVPILSGPPATPVKPADPSQKIPSQTTPVPIEDEPASAPAPNDDDDDELAATIRRRDALRAKVETLQVKVEKLESAVVRSQPPPGASEATEPIDPPDLDELIDLLVDPASDSRSRHHHLTGPPTASPNLDAFLPFSAPPAYLSDATAAFLDPTTRDYEHDVEHDNEDLDDEAGSLLSSLAIPSHKPLPSTLDQLRLFTPLNVTGSISLTDPTSPSTSSTTTTLQLEAPARLLTATVVLTSSSSTHAVESLAVVELSPWAAPELNPFLSAGSLNPLNACWAITRYWTLSLTRARCWRRCRRKFPSLAVEYADSSSSSSSSSSEDDNSDDEDEDDDHEDLEKRPEEKKKKKKKKKKSRPLSRRTLLPLLGRTTLTLRDDAAGVTLTISWHIGFDWTGEPESRVDAAATVPRAWRESDKERRSLDKIPELFQTLLLDRGVFGAVAVVVGILFSNSDG